MRINTGSWHYNLYALTYEMSDERIPPTQTTLCQYVTRLVFGGSWTLVKLSIAMTFLVTITMVVHLARALVGYRPVARQKSDLLCFLECDYVPYPLPKVGSNRLLPIYVVLLGMVVWLAVVNWVIAWYVVMGLSILAMCVALFLLTLRSTRTETGKLVLAWLKSGKEQVCPLVTFHDGPTEVETQQLNAG